jgi:hypothetical protein
MKHLPIIFQGNPQELIEKYLINKKNNYKVIVQATFHYEKQ